MAALSHFTPFSPTQSSLFLSSAARLDACRLPSFFLNPFPRSLLAREFRHSFASLSADSRPHRTCTRANGADLGNPEELDRLEAEHFIGASFEGASELSGSYGGNGLEEPDLFLREKIEATSQLNESVQSLSADDRDVAGDEGGGGNINSGGRDGSGGNGRDGEGESENREKGMSASQVLTLVYATLVGVGGVIGYAKSKSKKSLISGVVSSLILYYVSTQLPINLVYASSIGLGVSALLLAVMGIRYKNSGKFFPAGLVSVVSLIMTGGYIHGIVRSGNV